MKIIKLFAGLVTVITVLIILISHNLSDQVVKTPSYAGEVVAYLINPVGKAEYRDFGAVDLNGQKFNLVVFKTKVLFFEDTEKIYSDLNSFLPIKIERNVSKPWGKEYIIEDYDQKRFIVVTRKLKKNKIIFELITQANGPIHNAITLPFYLRRSQALKIGWNFLARVPLEFKLTLVSIEQIVVPAGKFWAYHFKSNPDKFEIWINKDLPQVPLKIQGKGVLDYALLMKKYSLEPKF
jgi:hypothetical protein